MIDWEVTATTVFCESVNDEATLIVSGDGVVKCTGRQKYEKPRKDVTNTLKSKSKMTGKQLKCDGEACIITKQYRDKMLGEK